MFDFKAPLMGLFCGQHTSLPFPLFFSLVLKFTSVAQRWAVFLRVIFRSDERVFILLLVGLYLGLLWVEFCDR